MAVASDQFDLLGTHEEIPRLTVLSHGMGQDSMAISEMLINDDDFRRRYAPNDLLVIHSDTGDEHPESYLAQWRLRKRLKDAGIEFLCVTPDLGYHGKNWTSLRGQYRANNTVGSKAFPKVCTDRLKIQPMYRALEDWLCRRYGVAGGKKAGFHNFMARYGRIHVLLGIAAGEESRIAPDDPNAPGWWRTIRRVYPLVDLGMDRAACQRYIADQGQPVPPPSNCMLCPFMDKRELLWLSRAYPESYEDWVDIEARKFEKFAHKGDKNYGVWGKKSLPQVLAEAEAEFGHMTTEELAEHRFSHGHCVGARY